MATKKQSNAKKLRRFMYKHCITNRELGEVLGLCPKQTWNIKMGRCALSVDSAWKLDHLTDGHVAWYNWVEDTSEKAIKKYKQNRYTLEQKKKIRKQLRLVNS